MQLGVDSLLSLLKGLGSTPALGENVFRWLPSYGAFQGWSAAEPQWAAIVTDRIVASRPLSLGAGTFPPSTPTAAATFHCSSSGSKAVEGFWVSGSV